MAGAVEARLVCDDSVSLVVVFELVVAACKDGEGWLGMIRGINDNSSSSSSLR